MELPQSELVCQECHCVCSTCVNPDNVFTHKQIKELRSHLLQSQTRITELESEFVCGTQFAESELMSCQEELIDISEKYRRLRENHKELLKLNEDLEEKLLTSAFEHENERRDLNKETVNVTQKLVEAQLTINKLEEESDRIRRDCNIAVQLLQCNPATFIAHPINKLPPDLQSRIQKELTIELDDKGCPTTKVSKAKSLIERLEIQQQHCRVNEDDEHVPTSVLVKILQKDEPDKRHKMTRRVYIDVEYVDRGIQTEGGIAPKKVKKPRKLKTKRDTSGSRSVDLLQPCLSQSPQQADTSPEGSVLSIAVETPTPMANTSPVPDERPRATSAEEHGAHFTVAATESQTDLPGREDDEVTVEDDPSSIIESPERSMPNTDGLVEIKARPGQDVEMGAIGNDFHPRSVVETGVGVEDGCVAVDPLMWVDSAGCSAWVEGRDPAGGDVVEADDVESGQGERLLTAAAFDDTLKHLRLACDPEAVVNVFVNPADTALQTMVNDEKQNLMQRSVIKPPCADHDDRTASVPLLLPVTPDNGDQDPAGPSTLPVAGTYSNAHPIAREGDPEHADYVEIDYITDVIREINDSKLKENNYSVSKFAPNIINNPYCPSYSFTQGAYPRPGPRNHSPLSPIQGDKINNNVPTNQGLASDLGPPPSNLRLSSAPKGQRGHIASDPIVPLDNQDSSSLNNETRGQDSDDVKTRPVRKYKILNLEESPAQTQETGAGSSPPRDDPVSIGDSRGRSYSVGAGGVIQYTYNTASFNKQLRRISQV